jgi:serine/threonine protein kinase
MLIPGHFEGLLGLTIGETLGRGAFGAVYRARHHALAIDVAVKVIETSALDAQGVDRALREARLMARLDHPNLLRIFHAGQTGGTVYFVLESMDGGSCKVMRNLPPERAARSPGSCCPPFRHFTTPASSTGTSSRRTACTAPTTPA